MLPRNKCLRCGYEWIPRKDSRSVLCPKCLSAYWYKPRIYKTKRMIEEAKTNESQ